MTLAKDIKNKMDRKNVRALTSTHTHTIKIHAVQREREREMYAALQSSHPLFLSPLLTFIHAGCRYTVP